MRVATYNVHDCVGRDGRFGPGRIAEVLAELDAEVIALQEVTLDRAGELIRLFEAATALRATDGTVFERGVGRYGNVVLTRHAVTAPRLHDLSCVGREPRGAIDVVIEMNGGPLRVCATHLGLARSERKRQIDRLCALLCGRPGAALLLGDFNVWWGSTALAPLAAGGFEHVRVPSFPTWPCPVISLDRIFALAPLLIARCWRHDSPLARIASDHFPLLADLQIRLRGTTPGTRREALASR
ncbi:MAG: endonuclease/exonuclease/phosphatase family protein [Chromatiaceae bacterium]